MLVNFASIKKTNFISIIWTKFFNPIFHLIFQVWVFLYLYICGTKETQKVCTLELIPIIFCSFASLNAASVPNCSVSFQVWIWICFKSICLGLYTHPQSEPILSFPILFIFFFPNYSDKSNIFSLYLIFFFHIFHLFLLSDFFIFIPVNSI